MQKISCAEDDTFTIIYNCRKHSNSQNQPRKNKRQNHDYPTLPQSMIITRRMAAEIQHKHAQTQQIKSQSEQLEQMLSQQLQMKNKVSFFDQQELDRCISIEDLPIEDVFYNQTGLNMSSNYSKLQRTLYGIGITAYGEEMEESPKQTFND